MTVISDTPLTGDLGDLGRVYRIGRISDGGCYNSFGWSIYYLDYSVDCENFTNLFQGGEWTGDILARCFSRRCDTCEGCGWGTHYRGITVYELLYTTMMNVSLDRTFTPINTQFTITVSNVKDQYLNLMNNQRIVVDVIKEDESILTTINKNTTNGEVSFVITTFYVDGWTPGRYTVKVTSDSLVQQFYIDVSYVGIINFNATCADIGTVCNAEVYLDGQFKGYTPLTIQDVPVGSHDYKISKTGYYDVTGTAIVQQSITTTINVELTLQQGCIHFITNPSGAKIIIDGVDTLKRTPYIVCGISIGVPHTYRLILEGYTTIEDTITLISGEGLLITHDLTTCTPNWQCERPFNSYESDGCGNRRLNPVCNPILTTITIYPISSSIYVGDFQLFTAQCKDQNVEITTCPTLTWSSSNPSIASVNQTGLVTGVSPGIATIITTDGIVSGIATIVVSLIPTELAVINIYPFARSINIGESYQLTTQCKDRNDNIITCPTLTWESDNVSITTVDQTGLVTGVSPGIATITATDGKITGNAIVMVSSPVVQAGFGTLEKFALIGLFIGMLYMSAKSKSIRKSASVMIK